MSSVDFTHPHWLWVLPPALGWVLWLVRVSDAQAGPWRRWGACALRLVVVSAVILALAGMRWREAVEGMNLIFVLDRSESVPHEQQEQARRWAREVSAKKPQDDRVGVVVFGAEASLEATPSILPALEKIQAVVPTERTDISSALRLASAAFPEHGQRRIVLVSDGHENQGDALAAAAAARALDITVDVAPLGAEARQDVAVQRVQLPADVKEGQPFEVRIFLRADEPGPATVRLYRNDQFLGEQPVALEAGKNLFTFPQTLPTPGFYSYDVRVEAAQDRVPQNNRAQAFTRVVGKPRVLVVSSDPAADTPLWQALNAPEVDCQLTGVAGLPETLAAWQSWDAIVFCNLLAGDLTREQHGMLETAVRDFGVGLVCVGGDQAYGAGAYRGTPLARVLPVEVELSSKKVLPPGALMLVIDRSGSMAGDKLEMARQAAAAAVAALAPNDLVGVIAFDGAPHVVVPLQPARDRNEIMRRIMSISVGGGTVMYPAMVQAHELLQRATASFKHCVLLTDGVSQPGDFEGITRTMAQDRITVSTVGLGEDIDGPLLEFIAAAGQGRFYFVPTPAQLPQVFIKEAAVVLKSAIVEEPFYPRLAASTDPVRGLTTYPQLLGYVVTEPKPRAETPLVTEQGDPLLAHWYYGLGAVVAFTSDARAKWARDWVAWDRYQQFWRQVVQWSLRRLDNANLDVEITADRGQGRVRVEALDAAGNYRDFLQLQGTVYAPGGSRQVLRLQQTGPGLYEAAFEMRQPGVYMCNVLVIEEGEVRATQTAGASLNHAPEFEATGPNLALLRRLAETTGGQVLDLAHPGLNPFLEGRRKTWRPHDLRDLLLQLALILFVLDVGWRRVSPDPEQLAKFRAALGNFLARWKPVPASATEPTPLSPLLARRDQVRAQREPAAEPVPLQVAPPQPAPTSGTSSPSGESPHPAVNQPISVASRLLEAKRRRAGTLGASTPPRS